MLAKMRLAVEFQARSLVTWLIMVTVLGPGARPTEMLSEARLLARFGSVVSLVALARRRARPALVPMKLSFTVPMAPLVRLLSQQTSPAVDCVHAPPLLRTTELSRELFGKVWATTKFDAVFGP